MLFPPPLYTPSYSGDELASSGEILESQPSPKHKEKPQLQDQEKQETVQATGDAKVMDILPPYEDDPGMYASM